MVTIFRSCSLAKIFQIGHAGHGAVVFHDFADDAGRFQAGDPGQINGPFRLPGSARGPRPSWRGWERCVRG